MYDTLFNNFIFVYNWYQKILASMKMLSVSNTLYTVQLLSLTQKYISRRESEVDITTHEQVFGKKNIEI